MSHLKTTIKTTTFNSKYKLVKFVFNETRIDNL